MTRVAQIAAWPARMAAIISHGFASRSRREQGLLMLALALATGFVLVQGGWRPLIAARADLLATIARQEQALTRLAQLPAPQTERLTPDPRPLPEILTDSAADYGLTIHRLESRADAADVVLEDAAFDGLILWLDGLEADHGLRIAVLDLARRPEAGAVTARLTVTGEKP